MRAPRIADGDVRPNGGGNPFGSRHHRKHETYPAKVGPDAKRTRRKGVGNPHVDVNGLIETVGQRESARFLQA